LRELVISYSAQDLFSALTAVDSTGSTPQSIASSQTFLPKQGTDISDPLEKRKLFLAEEAKHYAQARSTMFQDND
jgi:hypothetical protein